MVGNDEWIEGRDLYTEDEAKSLDFVHMSATKSDDRSLALGSQQSGEMSQKAAESVEM